MDTFFKILEGVIVFILSVVTLVLTIMVVYTFVDMFASDDNYSYVMDDGTSGTAGYCDNGKGGLYCTKDGRTFTVKEFSR